MQIIAVVKKILKTVQSNLIFILNVLSESSIQFTQLSIVLAKKILVFSHKMVFIENEPALLAHLCGNVQGHLQLFSVKVFDIASAIKNFSFCGALLKRILAWKRGISKR